MPANHPRAGKIARAKLFIGPGQFAAPLEFRPRAGARLREDLHVNRTFKTVALPILVVFVLVYVAQSMFHFGGSSTPTKKAGWGSLVQTASTKRAPRRCSR